jgi:hypothetical protein
MCAFLLNREGQVLWRADRAFTVEKSKSLAAAVQGKVCDETE